MWPSPAHPLPLPRPLARGCRAAGGASVPGTLDAQACARYPSLILHDEYFPRNPPHPHHAHCLPRSPLLNAAGIHEPWALRSIIEIETASGLVGINESYGDQPMLEALAKAAPALVGLSPWALNDMEVRVAALVTPPKLTASEFLGQQVSLAPGTHVSKTVAKVVSAFEVAMLDLQGQMAQAPSSTCWAALRATACPTQPICSTSMLSMWASPMPPTPGAKP